MSHDNLGDRMKKNYEDRTRYSLPRRTYTLIRVDGKAFHGLKLEKPFDRSFMGAMRSTALALCQEIQGAKFAYTQSDEISILVTDFDQITTEAWFDGNIQKIVSISAAIASVNFNWYYWSEEKTNNVHVFDSRVFTIPDPIEVENYFIWREQDATRNSIQMAAGSVFSHKQMHKKNTSDLQEMLHSKGINWNDYRTDEKRGSVVRKDPEKGWLIDMNIPVFTQDRSYLRNMIPKLQSE